MFCKRFTAYSLIGIVVVVLQHVHCAAPVFEAMPSFISVTEDFPIGGPLLTFRVTDSDPGDVITLGFVNNESSIFVTLEETRTSENDVTVTVKTKRILDRDQPGSSPLRLAFTATDSTFSQVTSYLDVYILDVNDNKPTFLHRPYVVFIEESTVPSVVFVNVTATDPDNGINGSVTYSLVEDVSVAHTFAIDSSTAKITLLKKLDFEKRNFYVLHITASVTKPSISQGCYIPFKVHIPPSTDQILEQMFTVPKPTDDQDGGGLHTTTDMVVNVVDVQDEAPFFIGSPYYASMKETDEAGHLVLSVSGLDGDFRKENNVTFAIQSDDCGNLFFIDSYSGDISLSHAVPTDLTKNVCRLNVTITEVEHHLPQTGVTQASTSCTITTEKTGNPNGQTNSTVLPCVCHCSCCNTNNP